MKFQFVLFILGRKVKGRAKNDPDYKKKVSEKNCTVQIKTADNSMGRYYKFNDGTVTSKKGITGESDVSLVWKDAATGFETMTSTSAAKKVMEALQNGGLKFEGDGAIALWFFDVIKHA